MRLRLLLALAVLLPRLVFAQGAGFGGPLCGLGPSGSRCVTGIPDVLNVKDKGACGNGVCDDTVALTAAINALPATGGALYFPPGTYKVSAALPIVGKSLYFGAGRLASVIDTFTSGTGFSVFQISTPRTCTGGTGSCDSAVGAAGRGANCVCYTSADCQSGTCAGGTAQRDFVMANLGVSVRLNNSTGIDAALISDSTFRELRILRQGSATSVVGINFSDGDATVSGYSNELIDSKVDAFDTACARILPRGNDTRITNNTFGNTCGTGVLVATSVNTGAVRISGNMFQSDTIGVDDHGNGTTIVNNRFESNGTDIQLRADSGAKNVTFGFNSYATKTIGDDGMAGIVDTDLGVGRCESARMMWVSTDGFGVPPATAARLTQGSANQIFCQKFRLPCTMDATKIGFELSALGGAGSKCGVAIYSGDGTTLLLDSGVQLCDAGGNKTATGLTRKTLRAGMMYAGCFASDQTVTLAFLGWSGGTSAVTTIFAAEQATFTAANAWSNATAFPSSTGALSANTAFGIWIGLGG